jgi:hypothetical protein
MTSATSFGALARVALNRRVETDGAATRVILKFSCSCHYISL